MPFPAQPKDILRTMAAHTIIDADAVARMCADLDPATVKEGDAERIGWALSVITPCLACLAPLCLAHLRLPR